MPVRPYVHLPIICMLWYLHPMIFMQFNIHCMLSRLRSTILCIYLLWYSCYLSSFLFLAQHDYTLHLMLKYHPPEVINSVRKWCLSGNIRPPLSVALELVKGNHNK